MDAVSAGRAWSVKVWAAGFKAVQFPVGVWNFILSNQGWSETWAPVQTDILKGLFFWPSTGLANILRARAQIADNFRRNSYAC